MKIGKLGFLAGASLVALACTTARAQSTTGADSTGAGFELEEIVVTARRKDESLQDVPQTVSAVTTEEITKLNLLDFRDLQAVLPGVTLAADNTGYGVSASMRGVTYNGASGANPPTVAYYMNDAPIGANLSFKSMFDVGQVEALRGPQGTVRGIAAPSGAITLTTRKPDLYKFGGYADVSASTLNAYNAQGAFNAPIISDMLAIRVAGVVNDDEYTGIRSINNPAEPHSYSKAYRASINFQPADFLSANFMYQKLTKDYRSYDQVAGPGNGTNGPPIESGQRLGVTDGSRYTTEANEILTGLVDWRFFGQKLSYVGAWSYINIEAIAPQDKANVSVAPSPNEFYQLVGTRNRQRTHEVRLASEEMQWGFLDYTVGYFHSSLDPVVDVDNGRIFSFLNFPRTLIQGGGPATESSEFGSLTFHVTPSTEITAGARRIHAQSNSLLRLFLQTSATGTPAPLTSFPSNYDETSWIYSGAVSQHITDNFLVYANYGTSFRPGPTAVGITNGTHDPRLDAISVLKPEKSRSYEVGFKATALDKRLSVNVALYDQKFDGFFYTGTSTYYLSDNGATAPTLASFVPTSNADAKVRGIDLDSAFAITPRWNAGLAASYSHGKLSNAAVPCNDSNFDGIPDAPNAPPPTIANFQAAGQHIALCNSNASTSSSPDWNATLQSEYSLPIGSSVDGFVRGLLTYYPENKNTGGVDFHTGTKFVADSYGLLNLYLGVRDPKGIWSATAFAKNVTNTEKTLTIDQAQTLSGGGLTTLGNYYGTSFTPRREFGLNLHYAFGSR